MKKLRCALFGMDVINLVKSVVIVMYIVQTANTGKIVRLLQRPESLPCLCNGKGTGRIKFLQAIWSIPVLLPIF
ncbi:hypothetical protein IR149_21250 [Bacteroides acidifaciens]|uniref:Uncharacterized protein n=1 Tax=Bacteroides acidifaciens TaxID=85831 RepID=A0A7J0A7H1_9BACE|nr:hypothetical protein [Bacteroides acidifaciens]MBF0836936.1 hypothetical protein [Bacteroides acidifaciens]GFH88353.1 hypothetical protein IMSAGC001_03795 [Bacteroides acidifaciens]